MRGRYQAMSLTKFLLSAMPASASNVQLYDVVTKSDETTCSSVYPRMPLRRPCSLAVFIVALISSYVAYIHNISTGTQLTVDLWQRFVLVITLTR